MGLSTVLYRLLALAAVLMLANGLVLGKRRVVNCRVYVFAPACRGISAKRAFQDTADFDDAVSPTDMEDDILTDDLDTSTQDSADSWLRSDRLVQALLKDMLGNRPVAVAPAPPKSKRLRPYKHLELNNLLRFLLSRDASEAEPFA